MIRQAWEICKATSTFIDVAMGVERSIDADAVCGGIDKPWKMAFCGKPGPHGSHRGDEAPPYTDGSTGRSKRC